MTGASDRLAESCKRPPPTLSTCRSIPSRSLNSSESCAREISSPCLSAASIYWPADSGARQKQLRKAFTSSPRSRRLITRRCIRLWILLKKADVVPDIVTASHFAAVQVWAEAVRRAGSGDPKKVIAALRSGEFYTAVGPVAFDEKGDRRDIQYSFLTWKDGHLVPGAKWRH